MNDPADYRQLFSRQIYRILFALVVLILGIGTLVYHFVEGFGWVDAYYFSVVTLATVGYGDYVPHTTFGKIFTTFYIFAGVGILTTFISFTMRKRAVRFEQRHDAQLQQKSKK